MPAARGAELPVRGRGGGEQILSAESIVDDTAKYAGYIPAVIPDLQFRLQRLDRDACRRAIERPVPLRGPRRPNRDAGECRKSAVRSSRVRPIPPRSPSA